LLGPLAFLQRVYDGNEGWVDLPTKVGGRWIPFYTEWPGNGMVARRVRASVRDHEDLYFSVICFSERGRRLDDALGSRWLWADLDHVHPIACERVGLTPTICWQSSPGRFQALWELTKVLDPQSLADMNRLLTYALDADKGGWDLTQVLRVPGTRNHKYVGAPKVRVLFDDGPIYGPKTLLKKLHKLVPVSAEHDEVQEYQPQLEWVIPARARALLRTPADQIVKGERSDRLWELECSLVEAGVPEKTIFELVWPCAWNKHAEVNTGDTQLRREISRAVRHVVQQSANRKAQEVADVPGAGTGESDQSVNGDMGLTVARTLGPVVFAGFMTQAFASPRWLVEDIWTAESHGIIGGEPKTSKSTLALALGLSVASGRPFLGRFPVHTTGPVLVVQEENSDWVMQDRLSRIAASYGLISKGPPSKFAGDPGLLGSGQRLWDPLFHDEVDLWLSNHTGFDLSSEDCREALVEDIERVRPVMVILDPLYLMLGDADENRAHELRPYLQWFLGLRYEFHLALAVVHHFRKAQKDFHVRPGQQLMGSATLHGWVESSLYVEKLESGDLDPRALSLRVTPEMRNMAPREPLDVTLRMGEPGDLEFSAEVRSADLQVDILSAVGEGISVNELAGVLKVERPTAKNMARAVGCTVKKSGSRANSSWWVYPPSSGGE
jgi:AAA domain/RepB DNA-primase N-terminal domain